MIAPYSEAAERNKAVICEALEPWFKDRDAVLEIGSGTGQHAIYFTDKLSWLTWQATEHSDCLDVLQAGLQGKAALENLLPIARLDVNDAADWKRCHSLLQVDAIYTANTFHIMSDASAKRCLSEGAKLLPSAGLFCVYGPFNRAGEYTSESNADFDVWLKSQHPDRGIRNDEDLFEVARLASMNLLEDIAMPANNRLLIWQKL